MKHGETELVRKVLSPRFVGSKTIEDGRQIADAFLSVDDRALMDIQGLWNAMIALNVSTPAKVGFASQVNQRVGAGYDSFFTSVGNGFGSFATANPEIVVDTVRQYGWTKSTDLPSFYKGLQANVSSPYVAGDILATTPSASISGIDAAAAMVNVDTNVGAFAPTYSSKLNEWAGIASGMQEGNL